MVSHVPSSGALEYFFNSVEHLFVILNGEGRVIRANFAYRKVVGPAGGADDASLFAHIVETDRSRIQTAVMKLGIGETLGDMHFVIQVGREVRALCASFYREAEDAIYLSARDLTDLDAVEKQRNEADDKLSRLETLVGIGAWRMVRAQESHWSAGMYRLCGFDEAAGLPSFVEFCEKLEQSDINKLNRALEHSYATGRALSLHLMLEVADGQRKRIEIAGAPIRGINGEITGLQGVAVDRTDVTNAIKSAMASKTSTRALMEYAPVEMVILDNDLRVLAVSREWMKSTGIAETDVVGLRFNQLQDFSCSSMRSSFAKVLKGESIHERCTQAFVQNKQVWLNWTATPWRNHEGRISGIILAHNDISEMVETQKEIELSKSRMSFALGMTSMMVWELDFVSKTHKLEGDWRAFHDTEPDFEFFSKHVFDVVHPADRANVIEQWKRHMSIGAPFRVTHRMINPAGREIWVASVTRRELDDNGNLIRVVGSLRDITSVRRTNLMVEAAEQRARAANVAKSALIERVASDVRGPIESMLNVTSALKSSGMNEHQTALIEMLEASSRIVLDLMNDTQDYARLGAQQVEFDLQPFDLGELITGCLDIETEFAARRGVELEVTRSPTVDAIYRGDSARIRDIVASLVNDAVERNENYIIELELDVEQSEEGLALFQFSMTDGAGHSLEIDEVITDEKAYVGGAAGLSVAIATRLIKLMKGSIEIRRTLEGERLVRLEVPLTYEVERDNTDGGLGSIADRVEALAPAVRLEGMSVLIAEDNPLYQRVLDLMANAFDLDVQYVENGEEAIEAVRYKPFHAILMDYHMPVMDGLTATQKIREWEKQSNRKETPIIFAIPNSTPDKVANAIEAGAQACIDKPVRQEDLVEQLSKLIAVETGDQEEVA